MKNILLPTDLSVQSLWPIKKMIETHNEQEPLTIHVIHMLEIPTSIGDLLLLGRNKKSLPMPYYFKDALQILQNKYNTNSIKIKFDFVYGSTSRILRNYMEAAGIQWVTLLDGYKYQFNNADSVNFIGFFNKLKMQVNLVPFKPVASSEFQVLSILLNDEKHVGGISEFSFQSALAV